MPKSTSEKLRKFYQIFSGNDQVLVIINADPDAIASAMAIKRLLWRRVAGVTISNINVIKRPDNIAMVRLMNIKLIHIDEIGDKHRFNRIIIVDSQPDHHPLFKRFTPDVVIDHHPITCPKVPFMDIRPEYGATASIMTEYLRSARIKPSEKLATALFHAIKTDTSNFERQTIAEDLRAFHFLFKYANPHLARKIEQSDLRLDFLKYFKIALNDMRLTKGRVFISLGQVVNPDICVIIADFFMRVNPIKWSIVTGVFEDKVIIIFRNDGIRKNAGKMAKQSFGTFGSAGGHKSAARAEIPVKQIEKFINTKDQKQLMQWVIGQIEGIQKKKKKTIR